MPRIIGESATLYFAVILEPERCFMRILAVGLLALFLLAGACGDDDSGGPEPNETDTVITNGGGGGLDTPTATAPSTPRPTPTPTPVPPCVPSAEALSVVGERTTVCGVVAGASYRPDVNGDPTFINFDRPFPNHTFTALVWGDNRGKFKTAPEDQFGAGATVCVEGLVEVFDGMPEIVVSDPAQIETC